MAESEGICVNQPMWDTTTLPPPSEERGAWWAERVIPEAHMLGTSVLGREAPEDLASVWGQLYSVPHVCMFVSGGLQAT